MQYLSNEPLSGGNHRPHNDSSAVRVAAEPLQVPIYLDRGNPPTHSYWGSTFPRPRSPENIRT